MNLLYDRLSIESGRSARDLIHCTSEPVARDAFSLIMGHCKVHHLSYLKYPKVETKLYIPRIWFYFPLVKH